MRFLTSQVQGAWNNESLFQSRLPVHIWFTIRDGRGFAQRGKTMLLGWLVGVRIMIEPVLAYHRNPAGKAARKPEGCVISYC